MITTRIACLIDFMVASSIFYRGIGEKMRMKTRGAGLGCGFVGSRRDAEAQSFLLMSEGWNSGWFSDVGLFGRKEDWGGGSEAFFG